MRVLGRAIVSGELALSGIQFHSNGVHGNYLIPRD